jgi:hypothetical protein
MGCTRSLFELVEVTLQQPMPLPICGNAMSFRPEWRPILLFVPIFGTAGHEVEEALFVLLPQPAHEDLF